jgi:hypothetical protein
VRRRRCGGCGDLTDPSKLAKVGGRRELCPDCLLAEAEAIGAVIGPPTPSTAVVGWEPADSPPEPLPLRSDEERFEGLKDVHVEGWPLVRGRLSASALSQFFRCPEQFRRAYVKGERRPSSGTGLAGTGAHGAIEAALRLKADRGLVATPKQIVDTYDAVYESAVARAIDREGIAWGRADKLDLDYDSARLLGRGAVEAYAAEVLPHVEAEEVELVFAFDLPGVAVPICGLIDVAGARSTIDLKFGGKTASKVDAGWRIQALIYGLARRQPVEFHATSWAGKAQTPRSHPGLRFAWDARQTIVAVRVVRMVVEAILTYAERWGEDGPWPGNLEHTWACNMCEYRTECPWWTLTPTDLLT